MGGLGGRETPLARAATGWRPQAVPVATKEAPGIDSRDEGFPFPPSSHTSAPCARFCSAAMSSAVLRTLCSFANHGFFVSS